MRFLFFLSFLLLAFLGPVFSKLSYAGHKVYRVIPASKEQIHAIEKFADESNYQVDFWTDCVAPGKWCDIHPDRSIDEDFTNFLTANSIEYSTMIGDIEQASKYQNSFQVFTDDWFSAYHDYDSTVSWLNQVVDTYSTLATLKAVGQSYENRTIWAVEIKSNKTSSATKPAFGFDGGIHAREWISPAVVQWQLYTLLSQYGKDSTITGLVDDFDWYIVPIYNVDGYSYTWTEDRMWRKTRAPNKGSACVGTDPCRNAPTGWGQPGASSSPCADDYRGTAALDQVEVKAMVNYFTAVPNLKAYINFHSYSQLFMSAWGYTYSLPPTADYKKQISLGKAVVAAIKSKHGTEFTSGPIASTIYQASGVMSDHIYGALGVVYSFSAELRDTGKYGFVLPADQIVPSGEEVFEGIKAIAKQILSEQAEQPALQVMPAEPAFPAVAVM